jgi:thiosulfate reductase cytochrome b subunit
MKKASGSRHPWPIRLCHWTNVLVMIGMLMSGWGIYNASPLFNFTFPAWMTLGGWLGGHIAWHLAVMWLLFANGVSYLVWGIMSGQFRGRFLPLSGRALWQDLFSALRLRLHHRGSDYNAVQKLMYLFVLVDGVLLVLSGLSIWKPVQFSGLVALFGGFDMARYVHFYAMSGLVLFTVVHVVMVILVPQTLWPMITGGKRSADRE